MTLAVTMLLTLLSGCNNSAEVESNTPSPSAAIEDGYIAAPYTAGSEAPTEYVAPVFYKNDGGPTISVTYVGVIQEDGKYFKDSDNDKELDPFEDWRLSTEERVADLVGKMTQDQRIGLLRNALMCSPDAKTAEEAYNADGSVNLGALLDLETKFYANEGFTLDQSALQEAMSKHFAAANVTETEVRSGVVRKDTDTETGALFNNALNLMTEYMAVSSGNVNIPFMLLSNPMRSGYPQAIGFGAVAAGSGYDVIQEYVELDAKIWDAKGIHQMYGPQIDLISDPRWPRNSDTYTEITKDMEGITAALVKGYQGGSNGVQLGGVSLIMKHFPGDGASENGFESHYHMGQWRLYPTAGSLEKYHLPGFQAAIDVGLAGIMPCYSRPSTDDRSVPQSYRGLNVNVEEVPAPIMPPSCSRC